MLACPVLGKQLDDEGRVGGGGGLRSGARRLGAGRGGWKGGEAEEGEGRQLVFECEVAGRGGWKGGEAERQGGGHPVLGVLVLQSAPGAPPFSEEDTGLLARPLL